LTLFDPAVYVEGEQAGGDQTWRMQPAVVNIPARVRWFGLSRQHGCFGTGVEFGENCGAVAELIKKR
jgi:hypothetical protein